MDYYLLYVEILKKGTCSEYFERSVEDPDFRTTGVKQNSNSPCTLFLMQLFTILVYTSFLHIYCLLFCVVHIFFAIYSLN